MNYSVNKNIIVEPYKCIFFILPKNGCTSVKARIVEVLNMPRSEKYPGDVHNSDTYPYPFADINELNTKYRDYFKFCILRNPFDRLISCYKDKIRTPDLNNAQFVNGVANPLVANSPLFFGGMSFAEFVDVVCSIPDSKAEHHFAGQLYQITDNQGRLLVDYIGTLETLKTDLRYIKEQTGFPIDHLPHLHKRPKRDTQEYYSTALIKKVEKRFAADVGFFNYRYAYNAEVVNTGLVDYTLRGKLSLSTWVNEIITEKNDALQAKLAGQIQKLKRRLELQERELEAIQQSQSWRLTGPARMVASWLGLGKKHKKSN